MEGMTTHRQPVGWADEGGPTAMTRLKKIFLSLGRLRSPWYHWYRGRRLVALGGMGLGMAVSGSVVAAISGFALLPLVFILAFDHLLAVLVVLYVLLRFSLPSFLPLGWVDWLMVKQVVTVALPGLLVTRLCTLWLATLAERRLVDQGADQGTGQVVEGDDAEPAVRVRHAERGDRRGRARRRHRSPRPAAGRG
jgi:hypothetical protein